MKVEVWPGMMGMKYVKALPSGYNEHINKHTLKAEPYIAVGKPSGVSGER